MILEVLLPFRIKNPHIRALADEYSERIQRYRPLYLRERFHPRPGHRLHPLILFDPRGVPVSTEGFVERLSIYEKKRGLKRLSFGIGDAEGRFPLDPEERWSAGFWTHPHELMVVILLEQIYRVLTILHNHPYAK